MNGLLGKMPSIRLAQAVVFEHGGIVLMDAYGRPRCGFQGIQARDMIEMAVRDENTDALQLLFLEGIQK